LTTLLYFNSSSNNGANVETNTESTQYDFSRFDAFMQDDIDNGFPGATVGVWYKGEIIKLGAYGYKQIHDENTPMRELGSTDHNNEPSLPASELDPVTADTIFGIASNSKMYGTVYAIQYLITQGKLSLDDKVSDHLNGYADAENAEATGKNAMSIRDLLYHTSGHAPVNDFHIGEEGDEFYSQDRARTLEIMKKVPLVHDRNTVFAYSDTGFMLLGQIIETVTGKRQDVFMQDTFYGPMGLTHTGYKLMDSPANGISYSIDQFAASETYGNTREGQVTFNNIRTETIRGEVHDEKAYYSMGSVAGHAGILSTAEDMLKLMSLMINDGEYAGVQYFSPEVIAEFTAPNPTSVPNASGTDTNIGYALGWNHNERFNKSWLFGPYASETTIGHSGWVGTATLIDRENDLMIVLLSNKKNSHIKMDCGHDICGSFEMDKAPIGDYDPVMDEVYKTLGLPRLKPETH
ncbi:serine hydrolase, partial [Vibrio sp.]|nr:serine hydrolase [Vibrio sp.]